MILYIRSLVLFVMMVSSSALATQDDGCPQGTYSVVQTPDGSTLSLLFDEYLLEVTGTKICNLEIPLDLPANLSLGVYKVDYRGFAKLSEGQFATLDVRYALGPRENGRTFRRKVKGVSEGEYLFKEALGAGAMKRVGCGSAATLNAMITLELQTGTQQDPAYVSLDTVDGAPKGGLVFYFDYKRCH